MGAQSRHSPSSNSPDEGSLRADSPSSNSPDEGPLRADTAPAATVLMRMLVTLYAGKIAGVCRISLDVNESWLCHFEVDTVLVGSTVSVSLHNRVCV